MALARLIHRAPPVVGIATPDDGWLCAALVISGRRPVWADDSDPGPAAALLHSLGLGELAGWEGLPFEATVQPDLGLKSTAGRLPAAGAEPLDPVQGPLITILTCTYNRADLLPQALATAQAQRWPCEILVVDDGSTDHTPAVLEATPGLRVLRQPNQGKPVALQAGLEAARGEAVLVLDDDDLLLPGALHLLGKALFDHPELAVAMADSVVIDGATLQPRDYLPCCRLPGAMTPLHTLQQVPALVSAALVRMSAQRAAGAYEPGMVRGEDMDMFLRLARQGPFEGLPLPVFMYRSHDAARGSSTGQWQKHSDPAEHRRRTLHFVKPVFRERWRVLAPAAKRQEGFAWAAGLFARDLLDEGRQELRRWPAPYSPSEAWVRTQLGRSSEPWVAPEALVVVDDGDPGALEACLQLHAADRAIHVCLEVPREPLESVRLYFQGQYAAQERLHRWVQHPGPWHLRVSSSPSWSPPPLTDRRLLPDLPAPDAVICAAAAAGWALPTPERPGLQRAAHPVARACTLLRQLIDQGQGSQAMAVAKQLMQALPTWPGTWLLTAQVFDHLGMSPQAAQCRAKAGAP
jgi:glycosyltransferase involved in cell wall biosynthesis